MGDVGMSGEDGMELLGKVKGVEMEMAKLGESKVVAEGGGGGAAAPEAVTSAAVRWEKFLPKMALRVLLVEADDSTRQIISALLKKCSYKVAAVSDGLKAWEVLKGRPSNIDLILTEVELPSISGYALLSLIMENESCKNIPVIMMSWQDSISMVYKCMLRGATDFLVKPVRKNELRNLWQHVWRKQASSIAAGLGPPNESSGQEKVEATAENNATSNHSSGFISCIQRNKKGIEKGRDDQSSCTKPESATEEEEGVEHVHEECHPQNEKRQPLYNAVTREGENCDDDEQGIGNNALPENSFREAIDLIGGFDNHLKGTIWTPTSICSASKFDILHMLDLSLRRSQRNSSINQVNDEMPKLNHSDASAFSRYINKPLQLSKSKSPSTCNQQEDHGTTSEKPPSDTHRPILNLPKHDSLPDNQTGQSEFAFSYSQNRDISHPIPVRGVRFGNVVNSYGPAAPSTYCEKPIPTTTHPSESFQQSNNFHPLDHQILSTQQLHSSVDQRNNNSIDQAENKQGSNLEELEDQGSGCNGMTNTVSVVKVPSKCGSVHEESFHLHDGPSHRAMQREAALTKFRMKRKDRCFEKKVRYESRKKLAEQRPRVKGQFVRQVPTDPQPGSSSTG